MRNELPKYLLVGPSCSTWLRQLAWERLVELHRRHIHAQKRSVQREERGFRLPEDSASTLQAPGCRRASPISHLLRQEQHERVHPGSLPHWASAIRKFVCATWSSFPSPKLPPFCIARAVKPPSCER